MIMVVNNIKHPVMCRQWQYPFPYFVDGQGNLNIHCFDFFLLLETDEWDKVDYNFWNYALQQVQILNVATSDILIAIRKFSSQVVIVL